MREEHHRLYDAREAEFALFALEKVPGDRATYAAVLEACQDFGRTWGHLDPVLDKSPPVLVPGTETADGKNEVVTAPETKQLVAAFRDAGFAELSTAGLPFAVRCAALSTLGAAFPANAMGLFVLTSCAADLLEAHGSDALKAAYLPQLRSSEFMGTMALSEAHAGSSLAAIRTAAVPVDGPPDPLGQAYSVKGDKMCTWCRPRPPCTSLPRSPCHRDLRSLPRFSWQHRPHASGAAPRRPARSGRDLVASSAQRPPGRDQERRRVCVAQQEDGPQSHLQRRVDP